MDIEKTHFVLSSDKDFPYVIFSVPTSEIDADLLSDVYYAAGHYNQHIIRVEAIDCGCMDSLIRNIHEKNGVQIND